MQCELRADVGINVTVQAVTAEKYRERLAGGKYDLYLGEYAGGKKPSVFYAYLAADYTDADGVSHTAMNTLGVVARNGKVLGFVHLG